jgi:hypothetical protein
MINPLSAVGGINALHTAVQAAQMDGCCANAMMRERPRRTRDNKPVCEFYLASSEYRRLDLHHRTYKRLGHETEHDFVLICERCHPGVHNTFNTGRKSLWTTTRKYGKWKQGYR